MDLDKDVYTTFEAADICNANITSIKNWIDQGKLKAFRTPGGHYRIEQKVLNAFLTRHGMPNPFAEREQKRILLIHRDAVLLETVRAELGAEYDYDYTDDVVDALLKLGQRKPDAAVVDWKIEDLDPVGLCEKVREHADLGGVNLIVIHKKGEPSAEALREAGADFTVSQKGGVAEICNALRRALL